MAALMASRTPRFMPLRLAPAFFVAAALAACPGPAVAVDAGSPAFTVQIAADPTEGAAMQVVLRDAIGRQPVQLSTTLVGRIDPGTLARDPGADRLAPQLGRA